MRVDAWVHGTAHEGKGGLGLVMKAAGKTRIVGWAINDVSPKRACVEALLLFFQTLTGTANLHLHIADEALATVLLEGEALDTYSDDCESLEGQVDDALASHEVQLCADTPNPDMDWAVAMAEWAAENAGNREGMLYDGDGSDAPARFRSPQKAQPRGQQLSHDQSIEVLRQGRALRFIKEDYEFYLVWKSEHKEPYEVPGRVVLTTAEFVALGAEDIENIVAVAEKFQGTVEITPLEEPDGVAASSAA